MRICIKEVAYHRNGVSGEGFHAARFTWEGRLMVASVFEGEGRVAVLDAEMAAETVEFAVNSWRGDEFEPALRVAIASFEAARSINPVHPARQKLRLVAGAGR